MTRISQLCYYPVKGLPGIALDSVALTRDRGFPSDRRFAIGDDSTPFDASQPQHLRKQQLVVQMKYERLAALATSYAPDTEALTLDHNGATSTFKLSSAEGAAACEDYLSDYMKGLISGRAKLICGEGISYTDLSTPCVSLINLNSVRALEQALGYPVDPRRFRANIYMEGLPAWEEEQWLGKTLKINDTELEVYRITDRCAAINVDPATAERDQTLQGLKRAFGHLNMGVYAKVVRGGTIRTDEEMLIQE